MKALVFCLVVLSASVASAQWGYVPIEQSRSYNWWRAPGYQYGYRPYLPVTDYYYGDGYWVEPVRQPITVYLRRDATDPYNVRLYNWRRR